MERLEGKTRYTQGDLQKFLDDGVDVLSNTPLATVPDRRFKIQRIGREGELALREILKDGTLGPPTMEVPDAEDPLYIKKEGKLHLRVKQTSPPTEEEAEALAKAHDRECTSLDPTAERLSERANTQTVLRNQERNEAQARIDRLRRERDMALGAEKSLRKQVEYIKGEGLEETVRERNEARLEAEQARTQRDEVARDLMLQTKERDEARRVNENLRDELVKTRAMWNEVGKQRDALMCTGEEMADMCKERDKLAREMNQLQRNYAELKKTEDGLSERLALTSKDLAMWRERSRAAESTVTELDAETVRLKRELRETREERDKAQWERKRMQDALDLQTKRVGELETSPVPIPCDQVLTIAADLMETAAKLSDMAVALARKSTS